MASRDVAAALAALEQENGKLLPEVVVDAARDPSSPLHSHFTWDDSDAARKQRLHEARTLIRTVKIDVVVRDVPMQVSGYVRDPEAEAKEAGYRRITVVKSEEDLARAALVDEMKRVANAVSRAKRLALVLGVQSDVDKIDELARGVMARASEQRMAA